MGFDYLPGDMLAALTADGLDAIDEMTIAYSVRGFGATRGTALSALEMIKGGDVEWRDGELRETPPRTSAPGSFELPLADRRAAGRALSGRRADDRPAPRRRPLACGW